MLRPPPSARRAIFLDRDGTIVADRHYVSNPDDISLLPGVQTALADLHHAGWLLFLLTNQSGVARGFYTLADVAACHRRLLDLLRLPPPGFAEICVAPEGPDEPAVYRKPSPRFIVESIHRHALDPAQCWMAGDKLSDVHAGLNAGIRSVHLGGAPGLALPPGVVACADLKEFATRLLAGQL